MHWKKTNILLFIFCLVVPVNRVCAQIDQMEFERYTVRQGLSNDAVNAIVQDDRGHIWVGTENGLNQFDGTGFRTFYQNKKGTGIPGNYVVALKYFGDHQLGVITRRGFQALNTDNYTFTNYFVQDTTVFHSYLNRSLDAIELNNDCYALLTVTGFYVFKKTGEQVFRYDHYKSTDVGVVHMVYGQTIFDIDGKHLALYVLDRQLGLYDIAKKKITPVLERKNSEWKGFFPQENSWTIRHQLNRDEYIFKPLRNDSIFYYNHRTRTRVGSKLPFHSIEEFYWASYVFFLDDSTFAINCTYGGIFVMHLDRKTGRITCDPEKQLREYRCNWIFKDRENRLWIGTNRGLLKQRTRPVKIRSWNYNSHPKESNAFFHRTFTYKNYIFLGRYSWTDGLYVIDARNMQLVKKVFFYGQQSEWNPICNIQSYYKDTLWVSTSAGLLWLKVPEFTYGKVKVPKALENTMLKLAPANREGKAWMCSVLDRVVAEYDLNKRTFTVYTPETQPAFPSVKAKHVVTDAYGDTWIGGHGLTRWNNQEKTFDRYMSHYPGMNRYEDNILCMQADDQGYLWFHCVNNGLLRYDIKKNTFTNYAEEEGIPSDIECISKVNNGKIWLGTRQGLIHFNTQTGTVATYNERDGLPDDHFTGDLYYDTYANRYLAGFNNYLLEFSGQVNDREEKKEVTVKQLIIRNSDTLYYPKDTLYLDYDQNDLVFNCGIIDYESNTPTLLSYRLDGRKTWNQLGPQPFIYLDNLRPGKHILEMKAVGQSKHVTVKVLTLYVAAPVWQRPWFILLVVVFLLLCIFLVFRQKLRSARKEGRLNQLLAEYEMKALHAQMNPHFIFNCLNSIKALVMYDRNEEASIYINRFSRLVRQNLDHSRKPFITLQQNIEYLQDYLEMEKFRFTNFNYSIQVDAAIQANEVRIAPMLLQPLVENAIWHGLQLNGENNVLSIRFIHRGDHVDCEIVDNGVGINRTMTEKKHRTGNSLGIENIQQRMQVLNEKYHLAYRLTVTDLSDLDPARKGTIVTVSFKSFDP